MNWNSECLTWKVCISLSSNNSIHLPQRPNKTPFAGLVFCKTSLHLHRSLGLLFLATFAAHRQQPYSGAGITQQNHPHKTQEGFLSRLLMWHVSKTSSLVSQCTAHICRDLWSWRDAHIFPRHQRALQPAHQGKAERGLLCIWNSTGRFSPQGLPSRSTKEHSVLHYSEGFFWGLSCPDRAGVFSALGQVHSSQVHSSPFHGQACPAVETLYFKGTCTLHWPIPHLVNTLSFPWLSVLEN